MRRLAVSVLLIGLVALAGPSALSGVAQEASPMAGMSATPAGAIAQPRLELVSDEGALGEAVDAAIAANSDVADKIRSGKVAAAGALIGAVMKQMRGQADAARVRELILERLS